MKIELGLLYKSTSHPSLIVKITEMSNSLDTDWIFAVHAYDDTFYTENDIVNNGGRRGRWHRNHFAHCFVPYINPNAIWKELNQ